jgi:hypothetical protein
VVQDVTTIGESWGGTLLVTGAILLLLGLTFLLITRSTRGLSVLVRCPMTGSTTVVQYIPDESGYVTDTVSCGAFPNGQPTTCGLPCLTGSVHTHVTAGSVDLL